MAYGKVDEENTSSICLCEVKTGEKIDLPMKFPQTYTYKS